MMMKRIFLIGLIVLGGVRVEPSLRAQQRPVMAEKGMVVSAHPEASRVGLEILKAGGNAIDAAVATEFALAVVFPIAGNIGGGGFMMVRLANGDEAIVDYREVASRHATETMYVNPSGEVNAELARVGALSVGVPGTVAGMVAIHKKYGKLPFEMVLKPAIGLAREGFRLTYEDASLLNRYRDLFIRFASSRKYFAQENAWRPGDRFRQPDLAKTLTRIAKSHGEDFYSGQIAGALVDEIRRNGGLIDAEDLKQYRVKWRTPLKTTYRGYTLSLMPPPSSGGVIIASLLNMIEPYPISEMGYLGSETVHLFGEAMRRVYADRAHYLGDPEFINIPLSGLLSERYLRSRMGNFRRDTVTASAAISFGPIAEHDETTHYAVVDQDGNAVSATTTLNGAFGSGLAVSKMGFLLNNEMDDFSLKPGVPNMYGVVGGKANAISPGKRMLSSMSPTIITKEGKLMMVIGTPGGSTIPTQVFQAVVNRIDFSMNIQDAVSRSRIHHQWLPDVMYYEQNGLSKDVIDALTAKGWTCTIRERWGNVNAIEILENQWKAGGADSRNQNTALGY